MQETRGHELVETYYCEILVLPDHKRSSLMCPSKFKFLWERDAQSNKMCSTATSNSVPFKCRLHRAFLCHWLCFMHLMRAQRVLFLSIPHSRVPSFPFNCLDNLAWEALLCQGCYLCPALEDTRKIKYCIRGWILCTDYTITTQLHDAPI